MEKIDSTALMPNAAAFSGELANLDAATAGPIDMVSEYWTPSMKGEKRRMFFMDLREERAIDQQTGTDVTLLVAYFVEPLPDGRKRVVRQASRRLTAVFDNFSDTIRAGMAFQITYMGKEKNATNSFMSDRWSIVPLKTE